MVMCLFRVISVVLVNNLWLGLEGMYLANCLSSHVKTTDWALVGKTSYTVLPFIHLIRLA